MEVKGFGCFEYLVSSAAQLFAIVEWTRQQSKEKQNKNRKLPPPEGLKRPFLWVEAERATWNHEEIGNKGPLYLYL